MDNAELQVCFVCKISRIRNNKFQGQHGFFADTNGTVFVRKLKRMKKMKSILGSPDRRI